MRSSIRVVLAMGAALVWAWVWAQPVPDTVSDSIVQVIAMDGSEIRRVGSGFAVTATGHVLTAAHLLDEDGPFVVTPLSTRAELVARVVFLDEDADLAVLAVNGLDLAPLELAMDGFEVGRRVFSAGVWPESGEPILVADSDEVVDAGMAEGAVGAHSELTVRGRPGPFELIEHNAMIPATGYGGPLLNDCGEVAAVNRAAPGVSAARLRQGHAPEDVVHAVRATIAEEWLQSEDIEISRSDIACTDALVVAQAQARESAEQLELAEGEAEEARAELDQAQQALEQATSEAEEANARVGELEAQYEAAVRTGDEQAETLRGELEAARDRQEQAQSAVDTLQEELAALQTRLDTESRANRTRLFAAVGAATVLLLVGFVLYLRRSRELAFARHEADRAQREASAALTASRQTQSNFVDCVLTGETGAKIPVTVKVPGALLGREGVVLGRSPTNATFLIDDPTLSREHARFFGDAGSLYLEDLGSTNGSRINGQRIGSGTPAPLEDGDVLELGEVKLRLVLSQ